MSDEYESTELVLNEASKLNGNAIQLDWFPVRPGTVRLKITGTDMVCEDDGHGNLISAGVAVGVINYKTGKGVLNRLPSVPATLFEATYYFNSE
jgi:hypothetical protein